MRRKNDIKAPDGFLLGGLRKVRQNGTILFHRQYWTAPTDWIGERVSVHIHEHHNLGPEGSIEAAPPGVHIYKARMDGRVVVLPRADRPDAKPFTRRTWRQKWDDENRGPQVDGGDDAG